MGDYLRVSGMEMKCDGAAAVIVCPRKWRHSLNRHQFEVLGIGCAALEAN